MNIITFINVKGGVGKTTISFNLSHAINKVATKKVLLIDMDFQQNLTYKAMKDINDRNLTIYDLLYNEDTFISDCIYDTHIPNCDIIPSELKFNAITDQVDVSKNPNIFYMLKNKLNALEEEYDYVLIDTHPNLDLITTIALMTSTHFIIPVKPESDSIYGIEFTTAYIEGIKKSHKNLTDLGIIITDVDRRTTLGKEM
ncbi:MAG: ParA family protein, partial [archaeon]